MDYLLDLLIRGLLLGCAAMVVAYLADEAGILHVASAGFMGVGGYTSALVCRDLGLPVGFSLFLTCVPGAALGILLFFLTRRLRAAYLAMGLLGVTVVLHGLMMNWVSLTGGPMGVVNIRPLPSFLGHRGVLIFLVLVPVVTAALYLPRTRFGVRVRAVRDDESLSEDLRLRPGYVRFALFVGSACLFTFLGGLYAHHLRFLDPSSFALRESIAILAMAFLVPVKSVLKGLVGGVLFVVLPEALRFVGLPGSVAAQLRQALFGFVLVAMVCLRRTAFSREVVASGGPGA